MPVQLVNMIPRSMSDEQEQDSEPCITVNPANSQEIVGTAFTPDPFQGPLAPIYVSTDGGATWALNFNVPSQTMTGDITVAFGGVNNKLYAGILRRPNPAPNVIRMNVLRTDDFRSAALMKVLDDRNGVDQPFVRAIAVGGKDRLFVGGNDFASPGGRTATIDRYLNAGTAKPKRQSIRIEARGTGTANQNGPAIRPACHPNGTAYGAFYGWRAFNRITRQVTADVVVVRDDPGAGNGAAPFTSLQDADTFVGQRVAVGVNFTWNALLGQQRIGGDLSVAVDPTDSRIAYVAWAADGPGGYTITVQRSADGGQMWAAPIRTIVNAVNPSLAVNSAGTLGLLFQQVDGNGAGARWVTQFDTTPDGGATWNQMVLARVPAMQPAPDFQPYIGDYANVVSIGPDFYGIFSANNTPDNGNFPNGVTYQRNADFTRRILLGTDGISTVPVSIDPFFFKVTGV
jgi:hypothetical protein